MIEKYLRGGTRRTELEERLLKARILPAGMDTASTKRL
jgi:hypothetical protein